MKHVPSVPKTWDVEADVVVVGFGAAGVATAVTAHELGAKVLILEKAPEGQEGGNTRVAGQGYLNTSSVKDGIAYLTALCGPYTVPEAMVLVWAEEMCNNNAWLASLGGDPHQHQHQPVGIEFPDLPGSGCVHKFHDGPTYGYSNTWKLFERLVKQRAISVLYQTPGRELIQHDITKEILGVRARRRNKSIAVKARRAVVLTCGGFENNQEMIRNYLPGVPCCYTSGTPYNEGDGITMAMSVGADLWHMNNYAGPSMALKVPEIRTTFSMQALAFQQAVSGRHDRGGSRRETLYRRKIQDPPRQSSSERVLASTVYSASDVYDLRSHPLFRRSALRQEPEPRLDANRRSTTGARTTALNWQGASGREYRGGLARRDRGHRATLRATQCDNGQPGSAFCARPSKCRWPIGGGKPRSTSTGCSSR
jgi:hypothetical protein